MAKAMTPGPWLVHTRRSPQRGKGCGLWIHGATQAGGNVIDTEAVDVYPLSDDDRRVIEAAPVAVEVLADIRGRLPEEYFLDKKYEVGFTGEQLLALDNVLRLARGIECDGCDGSGVRPNGDNGLGIKPPEGFVIVERCDTCDQFADDLDAAKSWGTNAHWQWEGRGDKKQSIQAIAMPKAGDV